MGRPAPIVVVPTRELPPLDLERWAAACSAAVGAGARLVSLFGRPDGAAVAATAVLHTPGGALTVLRAHAPRGSAYPAISAHLPAAQALERELWEQTGLLPAGHPWLKPVRFEGPRQQRMAEYPFFAMRGQEVHEVGVGPIHAGVIEPGHFRFMCHGERVAHLEIQLGYQHRGVETLLLQRPPLALAPLVESIAGDSSVAHAWGYCAAVEALAGTAAAPPADHARGVALELERIAMHLATLTGMATDIAFLQGGATYGRLRTAAINATQRLCGNRFGRGWLRPGGVRQALDAQRRDDLLATLAALAPDLAQVNALMRGARSVQARLRGTGVVAMRAALDLGLAGPVGRASGVPLDTRWDLPGALYAAQRIDLVTETGGDCWARLQLRLRETDESLRWLQRVLAAPAPDPGAAAPAAPAALLPHRLCVSVVEGHRGPVVQALETDADGRLLHYKVQDPSLANWFGLALALRDNEISDFPICNKSFDLSYCGNDL